MAQTLVAHLATEAVGPPPEYLTLVLCRDVYHCRPSELRGEKYEDIVKHLKCLTIEAQHRRK